MAVMKYPTVRDIESKVKVTIFTGGHLDFTKLRDDLLDWADEQGVEIFWIMCFLNTDKDNQGASVYFDDEIDAMAFKLAWI